MMNIDLSHKTVNFFNRVILKSAFTVAPVNRFILDLLPTVLHMGDPLAEWAFKCKIDQFDLDHMPSEWVYTEDGKNSKNVVLFLHGGGYVGFGPITHRGITTYLSKVSKSKVLAIRYRKAPEHVYPAQLNDALLAFDYLLAQGYSAKNITVMGDSAGGNLALALTQRLLQLGRETPSSVALISPWTDLTVCGASHTSNKDADPLIPLRRLKPIAKLYAGWHPLHDPLISPIYADYTNFPPIMIHVGSTEILLDDARRLAESASSYGCDVTLKVWDGACHVFQAWTQILPETRESLDEFADFMQKHWNSSYAN